jgi:hypothetical protein
MIREGKLGKEQKMSYFRIPNLRSITMGNKIVETVEEARDLGREKAKESAEKLKLKIKI